MYPSSISDAARFGVEPRIHSLDQLRAAMMLLGLVFHSSISFTWFSVPEVWPYQDAHRSPLLDILVFFIHIFRMPLFFLLAGFFAARLYDRRGLRYMLRNRMLRVGIPFVLFFLFLSPITDAGFLFANNGGANGGWGVGLSYLTNPAKWFGGGRLLHLWFLYYLLPLYALIALVSSAMKRVAGVRAERFARQLGPFMHHPLGVLFGAAACYVTLLPMRASTIDTPTGFLIQPRILFAYGVFMGLGWILYVNRDQVNRFAIRARTFVASGLLLSGAYLASNSKFLAAAAMWALIYGFLGLAVRYGGRGSPLSRYLADGSYWMYLVHLPFAVWIPGLLNGWNMHAGVKMLITLTATTICSLATYDLFVRSTAIGVLLNGRRYPRGLPAEPERARQASAGSA
ncbi:MAG: acyltransferase family protein [Candidatus Solibacter sp.]